MPVDRTLWRHPPFKPVEPIRRQWRCPTCESGSLRLKAKTLHFAETRQSREARDEEDSNPSDPTIYRFAGILECNSRQCSEVVLVAGVRYDYIDIDFWTDPDSGEEKYEQIDEEDFRIDYVNPSPPLITIPENCPTAVTAALKKAFVASWGDLWAAANHTRSCVEKLLDHLGEPQVRNLHQRIENYKERDEQRGSALLAVKWVGNVGSHADDISREDVYDAFDIIEIVLKDVFSRDYSKVAKSVDAINKRFLSSTLSIYHNLRHN